MVLGGLELSLQLTQGGQVVVQLGDISVISKMFLPKLESTGPQGFRSLEISTDEAYRTEIVVSLRQLKVLGRELSLL